MDQVANELKDMGVITSIESIHLVHQKWGNVIFDLVRKDAQNKVLTWLERHGLLRESDDLNSITNWYDMKSVAMGSIILAGRFAQWKYFWTDDCVLRGKFISENVEGS